MTFITRVSSTNLTLSFNEKICFFFSYFNAGFNPIICALRMRLLVFNFRGGTHMKQMGMLVVSLRGVNFGF